MKTFDELHAQLVTRAQERPADSGTVRLLDAGVHAIGKKLLEEAGESWLAAEYEGPQRTAEELSQLLYYVAVMMVANDLAPADVYRHL